MNNLMKLSSNKSTWDVRPMIGRTNTIQINYSIEFNSVRGFS